MIIVLPDSLPDLVTAEAWPEWVGRERGWPVRLRRQPSPCRTPLWPWSGPAGMGRGRGIAGKRSGWSCSCAETGRTGPSWPQRSGSPETRTAGWLSCVPVWKENSRWILYVHSLIISEIRFHYFDLGIFSTENNYGKLMLYITISHSNVLCKYPTFQITHS